MTSTKYVTVPVDVLQRHINRLDAEDLQSFGGELRFILASQPQDEGKEAGALSDDEAEALHRAADTLDDLGAPHNAAEVRAVLAAQGGKK